MTCWAHVSRALDKNSAKLKNKKLLKTFKEQVEAIHLTRTKPQMQALWKVVKENWVEAGETAMADWFENEYSDPSPMYSNPSQVLQPVSQELQPHSPRLEYLIPPSPMQVHD